MENKQNTKIYKSQILEYYFQKCDQLIKNEKYHCIQLLLHPLVAWRFHAHLPSVVRYAIKRRFGFIRLRLIFCRFNMIIAISSKSIRTDVYFFILSLSLKLNSDWIPYFYQSKNETAMNISVFCTLYFCICGKLFTYFYISIIPNKFIALASVLRTFISGWVHCLVLCQKYVRVPSN